MSRPIALLALLLLIPCASAQTRRVSTVLSDGWSVRQLDSNEPALVARMPAQVHDVLLEHKRIPDPRLSDNAAKVRWVADKDWEYTCKFRSPAGAGGPVFLEFQGLDTLATAWLNGAGIGRFDDMFRRYRVEVGKRLAPAGGENSLRVVFHSVTRHLEGFTPPAAHAGLIPKPRYIRKAPTDFSSYLGARPDFIKVGIYRDVVLDAPAESWIEDVWVRSELSPDFRQAVLRVRVETAGPARALEYRLVDPSGRETAKGVAAPGEDFTIAVRQPRLWWPRLYGPQNLYTLSVGLRGGGLLLDALDTRVGMREVKPVMSDAASGEKRFRFDVNGRPIYFRGGCWAPIEHMSHCWFPERAARLFELAEHGNMNIFRIWGEGSEPPAEFYDECDRRGIMLWQDFWFANGMEPTDVPAFAANARTEIEEMVRRLRNHPSLLVWSGGNENFMSVEFARREFTLGRDLFLKTMPEIVARLDPGRHFHPSSPYGGRNPNWPLEGNWHDYTTVQFAPESSVPLWTSETLRASTPSLASMRQFLRPEELWPQGWSTAVRRPGQSAWPPAWEYHSTGPATWDRVGAVEKYPDAASAGELIRNIGTAHGEYLQDRLERQRRGVPDGAPDGNRRHWGNTVWRFNDPWPMIYSSVVDYYLEPKIAYYFVRRAYEPVLVSFERTPDWIAVWVTNDSPEPVSGKLEVQHLRFDGRQMGALSADVRLAPAESKRVLNLTGLGILSLREEFLRACFNGRDAHLLLIAERYLRLPKPNLKARRTGDSIEVSTDVFARQVTLEMEGGVGAAFDDNYFDLLPGASRTVKIRNAGGASRVIVRAVNAEPIALQ